MKPHLWTGVIDIALDAALAAVTNLSARAVVLGVATVGAESDLVALAGTVARDHGFRAVD